MFRSLATRLTATYVFAAILLVLVVVAAVTQSSLSMFALASREAMDAVARQAPFEVRMQTALAGSLKAAGPAIAENLTRPGLVVEVFAFEPQSHVFRASAAGSVLGRDKRPIVETAEFKHGPVGFAGSGGPPPDGPPTDFFGRHDEHLRHYPLGLDNVLHIVPRSVDVQRGRVHIRPDVESFQATMRDFLIAMIPIGLFTIAAAWLLGRFITDQALRPLVQTTASLNRFGAGDFTPRPVVTTDRNEIGELAKAYNLAAAQVTLAFEERRVAEANMRQFIADAGHELRTPLTVIMGFVDVLRKRATTDASTKIFDTMLAESRRMKALIDKLIVLARLENTSERALETFDLGEVAQHVVSALQALDTRPRIALAVGSGAVVRGEASDVHDALSNLVENALKYAPDSPIDVAVRSDGDFAIVDVIDRGPGIPIEEQEQVFSRFYRGRDRVDAEGFGLGLAIAKRAIERAGGTISLASAPGTGCAFSIRMPRVARGEAAALAV
jgi:two-component system OmpR family sensor kinase